MHRTGAVVSVVTALSPPQQNLSSVHSNIFRLVCWRLHHRHQREHEIEMFSQVKGNWDHLLVFSCHRRQVLPLRRFKLTDFSQRGANKLIETIDGVKQTWDRRGGSPRPRPPGCAKQTPQTYFNYFQGSLGGFLRLNCHRFSVSSWPAPAASVCEVNTKTRKLGKSLLH